MENSSFFEPWVGKDYETGGIFGKKLLVLGESLYCCDCEDCGVGKAHESKHNCRTTKMTIEEILNEYDKIGRYKTTYTKFERALYGDYTDSKLKEEIWNSVMFYNYVQIAMGDTRVSPTYANFKNSEKAFFEILEQYRPQGIIVWGRRLWGKMPGGDLWNELEPIEIEGEKERFGEYTLIDGSKIKVMSIYHPSWGFKPENWHPFIKLFIEKL